MVVTVACFANTRECTLLKQTKVNIVRMCSHVCSIFKYKCATYMCIYHFTIFLGGVVRLIPNIDVTSVRLRGSPRAAP